MGNTHQDRWGIPFLIAGAIVIVSAIVNAFLLFEHPKQLGFVIPEDSKFWQFTDSNKPKVEEEQQLMHERAEPASNDAEDDSNDDPNAQATGFLHALMLPGVL